MKQKCITPKVEPLTHPYMNLLLELFLMQGGALDVPDMDPDEVTPYSTPFGTPMKQEVSDTLHTPLNQGDIVKKLSFML